MRIPVRLKTTGFKTPPECNHDFIQKVEFVEQELMLITEPKSSVFLYDWQFTEIVKHLGKDGLRYYLITSNVSVAKETFNKIVELLVDEVLLENPLHMKMSSTRD